jgi:uncharacterized protein (DUF433 family)
MGDSKHEVARGRPEVCPSHAPRHTAREVAWFFGLRRTALDALLERGGARSQRPPLSFQHVVEAWWLRASLDLGGASSRPHRAKGSSSGLAARIERWARQVGGRGELAAAYLDRVGWERGVPVHFFPPTRSDPPFGPQVVLIDPRRAFGRPFVVARGIRTATLHARFEAGETVAALALDYDLSIEDIEEAIRFEMQRCGARRPI